MKKKYTGSIVRTVAAVVAGYAMADMDIQTIEYILEKIEQFLKVNKELVGLLGAVAVQAASIHEKHQTQKEKEKTHASNLNS